jgi:hypothetical protein
VLSGVKAFLLSGLGVLRVSPPCLSRKSISVFIFRTHPLTSVVSMLFYVHDVDTG